MKMKTAYKFLALLLVIFTGSNGYAQINPLGAQYFNNRYLINPAFAGATEGLKLNAAYRKQWTNVSGSPLTQSITADYGYEKVGLGLNVYNESAGLLKQTRVTGSYAYHLQLNSREDHLHFGISLGFMNQRLDNSDLYGNPNDPLVGLYNNRKTYIDGDFGIAYTSERFTLQAAVPNIKSLLKKDIIQLDDATTFYGAASYKFQIAQGAEGIDIEPIVAYRGVRGFDNILDAGAQLEIANKQIFLMGLYHSTKTATFGIGMDFRKKYMVSGSYTTQTSALNSYFNGSFEINLRLSLGK